MFFSPEAFEQLCPSYQKAVLKLENELLSITGENEEALQLKLNLLLNFSENYLTPKEIWDEFFRLNDKVYKYPNWCNYTKDMASKSNNLHFYFDDNYRSYFKDLHKRMLRYQFSSFPSDVLYPDERIRPRFTYPHSNLERGEFLVLDEYSASPITKEENERYQFMKDLYEKIIAAEKEDDDEKWFELLQKANNYQFLVHTVEYRLGKNLNNIKLWKLYINFCKQQESKKDLLNLLSKYCRYFLDDLKTKEEYKNAFQEQISLEGAVQMQQQYSTTNCVKFHSVNWKNFFEFEKYVPTKMPFISVHDYEYYGNFSIKPSAKFTKPNFDIHFTQAFSFSKLLMEYLLKNASPKLLHKLHKCCKYFFVTFPFPVCHHFCGLYYYERYFIIPKLTPILFNSQSIIIRDLASFNIQYSPPRYGPNDIHKFDNRLIISNTLNVNSQKRDFLSFIIKNLIMCKAKYIKIKHQNITFKEFEFLVGHGNVEKLKLNNIKIFDSADNLTPLEDILKMVPKITVFRMRNPFITAKTSQNMLNLKFDNYIKEFELDHLDNIFEANAFLAFLNKNFKPYFSVRLCFLAKNPDFKEFILNNYENARSDHCNFYLGIWSVCHTCTPQPRSRNKILEGAEKIWNKLKEKF